MIRFSIPLVILLAIALLLGGCDKAPNLSQMSLEELLSSGHYQEAQTRINQLWAQDSTSAEALYGKGLLAEYAGCKYEALIMHKLAILTDREFVPALRNYMRLATDFKEYGRAQAIGEHWFSVAPNDTLVNLYLARLAFNQHLLESADTLLDKAAKHCDDNILINLYRTELEVRSDEPDRIEQALKSIDRADFTSKIHYSMMAEIYDYLNQHDSTIAYARLATEKDPNDIYLKGKLAWYLFNSRNVLAADSVVLSILDSAPEYGPALILNAYTDKILMGGIQGEVTIQEFMQTVPDFPEGREKAGDFFYYFDDASSALFAYQMALSKAIQEDYPTSYRVHIGLKLGHFLVDTGQFPEGRSLYEEMIKIAPNNREWQFINAEFMYFFSDVRDSSRIVIDKLIKAEPNTEETLYQSGLFYKVSGDFDNAIKNFNRLITLPHPKQDYYCRLFDIYTIQRNCQAAQELAKKLPLRFRNDFKINELLYDIFGKFGTKDEALPYAEKLYYMAPHYLPYMNQLYTLYRDKGEKEKADQVFRDFLKRYPDNLAAYQHWADLALTYNDIDEATELVDKVMVIDSQNPTSVELQARLFYQMGQHNEAMKYFEKLLAENYGSAPIYYYMAVEEYNANGPTVKAANLAMNAANLSKGGKRELLLLGRIYYQQEKYKMARQQFHRGLLIYPDDPIFNYETGRSRVKLGEKDEARQDLKKALELGLPEDMKKDCERLLKQL